MRKQDFAEQDQVIAAGARFDVLWMKKECNFFPVDQQQSVERRPRSDSRIEASSHEAELSIPSPARAAGNPSAREAFVHNKQHLVAPIPEPRWQASYLPLSASSAGRGKSDGAPFDEENRTLTWFLAPFASRNFSEFSTAPPEGHSPWDSPTYLTQSPLSMNSAKTRPDDMSHFWRMGDSPGYMQPQHPMPSTPMSKFIIFTAGRSSFRCIFCARGWDMGTLTSSNGDEINVYGWPRRTTFSELQLCKFSYNCHETSVNQSSGLTSCALVT